MKLSESLKNACKVALFAAVFTITIHFLAPSSFIFSTLPLMGGIIGQTLLMASCCGALSFLSSHLIDYAYRRQFNSSSQKDQKGNYSFKTQPRFNPPTDNLSEHYPPQGNRVRGDLPTLRDSRKKPTKRQPLYRP